jgi:hypothetical protein
VTPLRTLLVVALVLLQAGLTAARAHGHADPAHHADAPHLHAHDLFGPFDSDHHDADADHDHDALELSDLTVAGGAPPAADVVALALAPAEASPARAPATEPSFPVGLPPSTAGPRLPRFLTFCALTI